MFPPLGRGRGITYLTEKRSSQGGYIAEAHIEAGVMWKEMAMVVDFKLIY
jgi:hypothetical protein